MAKLIPLSSKKMKEMGIVKSKNGFLMQPIKEKKVQKPMNNKLPERRVEDKAPLQHKEPVRSSTTVNSSISRIEKKQESQRLSDRGVY